MKKFTLSIIAVAASLCAAAQFQLTHDGKLRMAEKIIESFYVGDVDTAKVVDEGIRAMLKQLDPHSAYSTPEETRELNEPLQGNFSGIGIQFQMIADTLHVIQTISGGPSERVGLRPGDLILTANDSLISGAKRSNSAIQKLLRGPKGSEVVITVKRGNETEPVSFRIIRDDIPIYSVDAAYMATPTGGYIRVSRFAEDTPAEFRRAIEKLRAKGMKDLIIDLQDNGGGYLQSAVEMADMLLSPKDLIVYTEGDRTQRQEFHATGRNLLRDGRIAVLVNQYSASASEILSGAIQDNDRGVVVGRRTFGKGLVQRPFPFPDGSMIRLTVSRYFTPSGRCIQKPYTPGDTDAYSHDMKDRYDSGEFYHEDSVKLDRSVAYRTLKRGRTMYGGGGIMPDRFVPVDTAEWSTYYRNLMAKGVFNRFAVKYIDENRQQLRGAYPDEDAYVAGFNVDNGMIDRIVALGEADGVKPDAEGLETSRALIARIVKGLIGRDLFEQSTYFRVVNPSEPVYRTALDIITSKQAYSSLLEKK